MNESSTEVVMGYSLSIVGVVIEEDQMVLDTRIYHDGTEVAARKLGYHLEVMEAELEADLTQYLEAYKTEVENRLLQAEVDARLEAANLLARNLRGRRFVL